MSRRFQHTLALAVATLSVTGVTGCRDTAGALGRTPSVVRRNGDLFFGGMAARFTTVERSPRSAHARRRLIRAALVPSRAFNDTAVWTARPSVTQRSLLVAGRATERGYYFWDDAAAAPPTRPAESWHVMSLARLGDGVYRWNTAVDFAVGNAGAEHVAGIFGGMVGAAEGRVETRVRADYRTAFPRTTALLGQLASLDTLRLTPLADGSTMQYAVVRLDPNRLARRLPSFAAYLRKYISTGKARLVLRDRAGTVWMIADARDERMRFQLRTKAGRLAPLTGATRTLPDSMILEGDMTVRVKLFTVGFSRLVTDLTIERSPGLRAWTINARREPEWHLPLVTERLLRTSLRRPFAGRGASFRIGVRDERGTTLLVRSAELAVEESALLRFLSSLGGTIMDDFDPRTEREQHQYLREMFLAMRDDVRALSELGP